MTCWLKPFSLASGDLEFGDVLYYSIAFVSGELEFGPYEE